MRKERENTRISEAVHQPLLYWGFWKFSRNASNDHNKLCHISKLFAYHPYTECNLHYGTVTLFRLHFSPQIHNSILHTLHPAAQIQFEPSPKQYLKNLQQSVIHSWIQFELGKTPIKFTHNSNFAVGSTLVSASAGFMYVCFWILNTTTVSFVASSLMNCSFTSICLVLSW